MLILLPPSEGKNEGSHEQVLSLAKLSFSKFLTDARVRALTDSKLKAAKALTAPAYLDRKDKMNQAVATSTG